MQISLLIFNLAGLEQVLRTTSATEAILIDAIIPNTSFVTFMTFKVKPRSNFGMVWHQPPVIAYDMGVAAATF